MSEKKELKYQQLYRRLLEDIQSGRLGPRERLLPEEKLAEKYGVSRVTVRAALNSLEELGYITRYRGRGTFVREKMMEKKVSGVISFTQSILMAGNLPGSQVLELRKVKAPLVAMNYLGLGEEDEVCIVKRVRTVNGLTVLYEECYLVDSVCGDISMEDASNSILQALADRDVKPAVGKQELVAISAYAQLAKNLGVPEGFPILRSTMSFFTGNDRAVYLAITYYRTDRMTVTSTRYL